MTEFTFQRKITKRKQIAHEKKNTCSVALTLEIQQCNQKYLDLCRFAPKYHLAACQSNNLHKRIVLPLDYSGCKCYIVAVAVTVAFAVAAAVMVPVTFGNVTVTSSTSDAASSLQFFRISPCFFVVFLGAGLGIAVRRTFSVRNCSCCFYEEKKYN